MTPPVGSTRITDRMQTRSSRQYSRCRKANESLLSTGDNATEGKTLIYTLCGSTDRIASTAKSTGSVYGRNSKNRVDVKFRIHHSVKYRPEPRRNFPLWPGNPFEAEKSTGTASASTRNLPSGLPMGCRRAPENPLAPGHSFHFPYQRSEDRRSTASSDALTGCHHAVPKNREAGIRKRITRKQSATATARFLLSASFPQSRSVSSSVSATPALEIRGYSGSPISGSH